MELALFASILSGICLALMVVTDRLMVGDCYRGNPNHAWFVSSVAGSIFGLALTLTIFAGAIFVGKVTFSHLLGEVINIFWWRGVAMLIVGGLSIQVLIYYFRCFAQKAHSASIAAWLAATPIFVYAGMASVTLLSATDSVAKTSFDPLWIIGVILATLGLVTFERITERGADSMGIHRKDLILMLLFSVLSIIGLRQILGQSHNENKVIEVLAPMPYYWIGFAAGVRVIFKRGEWHSFKTNWRRRMRYFIVPILFVEVIGMLVFWFEYFGLTKLDPTYVSIITGASVFLVYGINLFLGRLRTRMIERGVRKVGVAGIQLVAHKLPHPIENIRHLMLELTAMFITVVGIALATPLLFE